MQHRIIKPSKLLNKHGELIQKGYATSPILEYRRKDVRITRKCRLKEWDYYLIYNNKFAFAVTVGSTPGAGIISVGFIDLKKPKETSKTTFSVFPFWQVKMPESSAVGDIKYNDCMFRLSIEHKDNARLINIVVKNFENCSDLEAAILLTNPPRDSMVIATPFKNDKKKFYYNQKIIGMRAWGKVCFNNKDYEFSPHNSFGLLDWGRGVWPYLTTWYWSAAQGIIDNNVFGFNLGYGFGDTSAATENMLFYKGKASKLEDIKFIIPKNDKNEYEYMEPWIITSSDNRFEADFVPIYDRQVDLSAIILSTEQHQVFGKFTGRAILDNGHVIEMKNFLGFAERVQNRW